MRRLFLLFVLFFVGTKGWGEPIKVGAILGAPFVITYDTTHSGIAVEIWDSIARGLNQPYTFVEYPRTKTQEAFEALKKGEIDVLIGPLSVTQTTLEKADFTLPYYVDKVIALVTRDYFHNLFTLFDMMFVSIKWILVVFFTSFIIYICLLWYYEREHISAIPKSYREGISYLFWKHILTGRHADEIPKSLQGKSLILFKTTLFYVIFTMLSATLISFLNVSLSEWTDPIRSLSDLEKREVGAIADSNSFKTGKHLGLRVLPFVSLKDGIQALEEGEVGAFLCDLSLADAYLKEREKKDINISHYVLRNDLHSFATRRESPLLRKINQHMVILRKNGILEKICKGYLDKGVKNCVL